MSASFPILLETVVVAPGTELVVNRIGYRHHGIYLGDGLVIHYAGRIRHSHGLIETISLRAFVGRRHVRVGRRPTQPLQGEEIVRRARSRLGERRYDILRNNCEHFSSWCYTAEGRSGQVDPILQKIASLKAAVRSSLSSFASSCLSRLSPASHAERAVCPAQSICEGRL